LDDYRYGASFWIHIRHRQRDAFAAFVDPHHHKMARPRGACHVRRIHIP
jgi:hypothetical protein